MYTIIYSDRSVPSRAQVNLKYMDTSMNSHDLWIPQSTAQTRAFFARLMEIHSRHFICTLPSETRKTSTEFIEIHATHRIPSHHKIPIRTKELRELLRHDEHMWSEQQEASKS